jgi:DNA-binding GntR family transcriptional regulator
MATDKKQTGSVSAAIKIDRVEQLTDRLAEDIALGRLKPRERLIEDELILRFDVKRNVVRQTLFELENWGLVERVKNKGAFVRYFDPSEVEDIYVVRELLEGKAVDLIPLPAAKELIAELKDILQKYLEAKAKDNLSVIFRQNTAFHKAINRACNNKALFEAIELYMMKSYAIRSYAFLYPELVSQMAEEHSEMIEALEKGDLARLKQLVLEHMKPAKEAYNQLNKM